MIAGAVVWASQLSRGLEEDELAVRLLARHVDSLGCLDAAVRSGERLDAGRKWSGRWGGSGCLVVVPRLVPS